MKNLIITFFIAIALINSSCSSPLSDTPISDPGLITPTIHVTHTDDDGGVYDKVSACLTDKNGAFIELMEGDIKVEGDLMEFAVTCYKRTITIKENQHYNVIITLADSAEYPFSVISPYYLKKVDYPGKVSKNESFEISWTSTGKGETQVVFSVQDTSSKWVNIFSEFTSNNSITVTPDNFPGGDINNGLITLTRTNSGDMPSGFNGGRIQAHCIFERSIKIK